MAKIRINNQESDFEQSITNNLVLLSEVERVGALESRQSGRTLPIKLPYNAANAKKFGFSNDIAIVDDDLAGVVDMTIESGSIQIFEGKAKRKATSAQNIEFSGFEDLLWIQTLQNAYFADDDIRPADYVWSEASINAYLTTQASGNPYDNSLEFIYAPTLYNDSGENPFTWLPRDLLPNLLVLPILERAFKKAGYTIQSDFLYTDEFKRLNLLFTWGRFSNNEEYYKQNTDFQASVTTTQNETVGASGFFVVEFNDDSTHPNYNDSGAYNDLTFTGTALENGVYDVDISGLTVDNVTGLTYSLAVYVNGIQEAYFGGITSTLTTGFNDTATLELEVGDTVQIYLDVINFLAGPQNLSITGGTIAFNKRVGYYADGDTVRFEEFLPDNVSVWELWTGIRHCFNLYHKVNTQDKTIRIEPRHNWVFGESQGDGFFKDDGTVQDVTEWVDTSKKNTIKDFDSLNKVVKLSYQKDDKDGYVSQTEKREQIRLYESEYNFPDRFKEGIKRSENPFFSPVIHTINGNAQYIVLIADIATEIADNYFERQFEFAPKLAYYKGDVSGAWNYDGVLQSDYPLNFAVNYIGTSTEEVNLSYATQDIARLQAASVESKGLARRFYLQHFATLKDRYFNPLYLKLDSLRYLLLDHRTIKGYQGTKLFLTSKRFNPITKTSAKCVLWKLKHPTQDDLDNLIHEDIPGLIDILTFGCASLEFSCNYDSPSGLICFTAYIIGNGNGASVEANAGSGFIPSTIACTTFEAILGFDIESCTNIDPNTHELSITNNGTGSTYEIRYGGGAWSTIDPDSFEVDVTNLQSGDDFYEIRETVASDCGDMYMTYALNCDGPSCECGDLSLLLRDVSEVTVCGNDTLQFRLTHCGNLQTTYTITILNPSDPCGEGGHTIENETITIGG